MATIGLLHPGAMGAAVGATLRNGGHDVVWVGGGRSRDTRHRAEAAGLREVPTVGQLVREAEAIVSVVPPHAALDVARDVAGHGFGGMYLDANAISPIRSREVGSVVAPRGARYVDGGIVGRPPEERGTTWLHLAGPDASVAAALFAAGPLETNVLGDRVGDASALKVAFAAWTKGSAALQAAMLAYAEAAGVDDALREQWDHYEAGFLGGAAARAERTAAKAWRFEGEMHEIAAAFEAEGVPGGFHRAAAEVYRRLAAVGPEGLPPARPRFTGLVEPRSPVAAGEARSDDDA
jgi:3-hydroxyisobutyrate dehydrogenase-like beta-hydroxyacid dehydrogenase